jgi:hypothetical protein
MALFRVLDDDRAQQLRASPPRNEKQVQTLMERNLDAIFGVRFVATEFSTGQRQRGRIALIKTAPLSSSNTSASATKTSSTRASFTSTGSWIIAATLRSQRAA